MRFIAVSAFGGASVGETEELVTFCRRMYPRILGSLSLYCGDTGLAEELTQDTLVRVCRDWRKVKTMEYPEAWTHRVAINFANSFFRRRAAEGRARRRLESLRVESSYEPDAPTALAIRHAVSCLPRRQREALVLHYYADLSFSEAASVMGAPVSTVKSLARRGIARLRDETGLTDLEEAPDAT